MNLNTNLKRLIAICTLTAITDIFINTFLMARFYEIAENAIQSIALYNILRYVLFAATIGFFGNIFKSKPLTSFRIGIVINFVVFIFIMFSDTDIMKYYLIIAVLFGVAQGAWYSPFAVLVGLFNDNPLKYATMSMILYRLFAIITPIVIGAYLTVTSFTMITVYMAILSVIQLLLTIGIEKRTVTVKYNLQGFIRKIQNVKEGTRLFNYYKISVIKGVTSTVLDQAIVIMIMMLFGTTLELGALSTAFAIITIITAWLMKSFYNKKLSRPVILCATIIPTMALMVLLVCTNKTTLVLYQMVSAVFLCVLNLLADKERFASLSEEIREQFTAEHQAVCEFTLAGGRIFGLIVLLVVNNLIGSLLSIKATLVLIGLAIILYGYYINKAEE